MDDPLKRPTDSIVSAFEGKLKQNIITKTLLAAKDGQSIKLTDEEMAYLTKQAVEESVFSQMEVKTPSPTITLKKGKTELNIRNASTLLQKMEEKYPTPKNPPLPQPFVCNGPSGDDKEDGEIIGSFTTTGEEIDEIIDELEKEVEGEEFNGPLPQTQEKADPSMVEKFKKCVNFPHSKVRPEIAAAVLGDEAVSKFQPINTVNRNAYEIREGVLAMALDFTKWQYEMAANQRGTETHIPLSIPSTSEAMDIAKKFYSFVENRR